jgi:hypothetical protein
MLHSTRIGKPHSGANERLIGGRNLEKYLIFIRGSEEQAERNSSAASIA